MCDTVSHWGLRSTWLHERGELGKQAVIGGFWGRINRLRDWVVHVIPWIDDGVGRRLGG